MVLVDVKCVKFVMEGDGSDSEDWLKNAMRARGLVMMSGGWKMSVGLFEYFFVEKVELEVGVKWDVEMWEWWWLDDENLEARRFEEAAAMKREAEMEEVVVLKVLDSYEEFLDVYGEVFELRYDVEMLGVNVFASSRSSVATIFSESDAKVFG